MGTSLKLYLTTTIKNNNSIDLTNKENLISRSNLINKYNNYNKEIKELSEKWNLLIREESSLEGGAFLLLIDNFKYAGANEDNAYPASSTIKIPLLVLAMKKIDNGELSLNSPVKLEKDLVQGDDKWKINRPANNIYSIHQLLIEMIRGKNDTATNLIVEKLGGRKSINEKLKLIGLKNTEINNLLPDVNLKNKTSAKDLVLAISLVESGDFISSRSRDLFREILFKSSSNKLLPLGLLEGLSDKTESIDSQLLFNGFRVYNHSGEIGGLAGDAGTIEMPDSKRAVAAFLVKGSINNSSPQRLIRNMSAAIVEIIKPIRILDFD